MATQVLERSPAPLAPLAREKAPESTEHLVPYRWILLLGLVLAAIMEVLDTTIN